MNVCGIAQYVKQAPSPAPAGGAVRAGGGRAPGRRALGGLRGARRGRRRGGGLAWEARGPARVRAPRAPAPPPPAPLPPPPPAPRPLPLRHPRPARPRQGGAGEAEPAAAEAPGTRAAPGGGAEIPARPGRNPRGEAAGSGAAAGGARRGGEEAPGPAPRARGCPRPPRPPRAPAGGRGRRVPAPRPRAFLLALAPPAVRPAPFPPLGVLATARPRPPGFASPPASRAPCSSHRFLPERAGARAPGRLGVGAQPGGARGESGEGRRGGWRAQDHSSASWCHGAPRSGAGSMFAERMNHYSPCPLLKEDFLRSTCCRARWGASRARAVQSYIAETRLSFLHLVFTLRSGGCSLQFGTRGRWGRRELGSPDRCL